MANRHVGVNLVEGAAVSPVQGISTAISALIGNFERGPVNKATLVTSMAQFESIFGSKPAPYTGSTSYYSVKAFFKKAGSAPLYIVRVASSTVLAATRTFNDSGAAATLKVDAKSPGSWGNAISVAVAASALLTTAPSATISAGATQATLNSVDGLEVGSDIELDNGTQQEYRRITAVDKAAKTITWTTGLTNTFTTANGVITSLEFQLSVYVNGVLVETHTGLGMNPNTTFFVEKKLSSDYIVATDVKATKDNDYQDLPAAATVIALTTGADGLADVTASDYTGSQTAKSGVYALDGVSDLFRFCCPNPILTDVDVSVAWTTLTQALMDYADGRATVMYYGDIEYAKSVANTVTFSGSFASRRLAFFWPWMKVVESGLDVWLPPSSFVIGAAVTKDARVGVHKNVGNESLPYATDLEYHVSQAEGETLNNAGVCTIRKLPGLGIRTYGGRTRSAETVWRFIHYSEYWNYVGQSLAIALQNVPFEPNNQLLWKSVVRRVTAFLANEHRAGALFDASNPNGVPYSVKMDETNNPADQVALGIATVEIEYVPVGTVEKFVVKVTSSPSGLSVNN